MDSYVLLGILHSLAPHVPLSRVVLLLAVLEQRASVVGQRMQREIQKKVVSYLKSNEIDSDKVRSHN